jgi:hypothetical protein
VSLSFSPTDNKPNEGPTGGGEGAGELDPADNPEPDAAAEGSGDPEPAGQAAA